MTIKQRVQKVDVLLGSHVNLRDPIVTEVLGSLGYDFLFLDMEHTTLSTQDVYHHLLAAKAVGTPVFVRVPADDLTNTKRVLEMGPDGIIFPMVKDAAHAKALLDWTVYPPYGKRGCGPKGAVRYGLDDEPTFYREGHLKLCRFVQIEQESAALDAENIAALPYVDGCILGMHDLSGSIGRLGEVFCERNVELANKAIDAFKKAGKTVGVSTYATDPATLQKYHDMGINMISTGADYDHILKKGTETFNTVKTIYKGE